MKKASAKRRDDDLRPEYDLSKLKGGVRGKYYRQAAAGTNLMLIEPELAEVFGDAESVNRALRLLVDTAEAVARPARGQRARTRRAAKAPVVSRTRDRRRSGFRALAVAFIVPIVSSPSRN